MWSGRTCVGVSITVSVIMLVIGVRVGVGFAEGMQAVNRTEIMMDLPPTFIINVSCLISDHFASFFSLNNHQDFPFSRGLDKMTITNFESESFPFSSQQPPTRLSPGYIYY